MTAFHGRRARRCALLGGAASLSLSALPAAAQELVVEDERTTPIVTSAAGDVTITGDGTLTVENQAAIIVDSDADLDLGGTVTVNGDLAGLAGVRFTGNTAGAFTQTGELFVDATAEPLRSRDPVAFPEQRYGIVVDGGATRTGDIVTATGAVIEVEAANGAGIAVLGTLDGDIVSAGTILAEGEGAAAIDIAGTVTGDVFLGPVTQNSTESVSAFGVGADAIRVDGTIGGTLTIAEAVRASAATDLRGETAESGTALTAAEQAALVSGHGLSVTGTIEDGVVIAASRAAIQATDDTDAVPARGPGSIALRGGGPAVSLDGGALLGLGEAGSETESYGLVVGGSVSADGGFAEIDATGLFIGDATVEGGVRITGTLSAGARGLNARSIGLDMSADADVDTIRNEGILAATAATDQGDAVALRAAGTGLSVITNTGVIVADLTDYSDNDPDTDADEGIPSGREIAADLTGLSGGVTFLNTVPEDFSGSAARRRDFGVIEGELIFGAGADSLISDAGRITGDIAFGGGANSLSLALGSVISGDVTFGAGADQVSLDGENTRLLGDLFMGGGGGTIAITGGATFEGLLTGASGMDLAVSGAGSRAAFLGGGETALGSLTTTGDGPSLAFAVDGTTGTVSSLAVGGDVDLSESTIIETVFSGAFAEDISAPLITAGGSLNAPIGALELQTVGGSAILFDQRLSLSEDGGALILTLDRKDAAALGLSPVFAPAYEPLIAGLVGSTGTDPDIGRAVFNLRTEETFQEAFRQFLPAPIEAPITYARVQNDSVTSIVTQRVESLRQGVSKERSFWLQEQSYFVRKDESAEAQGFDGGGFILALGADTPLFFLDTLGVSASIASARYDETSGADEPFDRLAYTVGAYAAERIGPIGIDGRISYGMATTKAERNVNLFSFNEEGQRTDEFEVRRSVQGEWDGTQIAAHGRIRYEANLGRWDVLPFVSIDYLSLTEDAYEETGGPTDLSIALAAEEIEATSLRANAGLAVGRRYNLNPSRFDTTIPAVLTPRVTAAFSQQLGDDEIEAQYRYLAGGESFTLTAQNEGSAAMLGADLLYENQYAHLGGGLFATLGEDTASVSLRLGVGLRW